MDTDRRSYIFVSDEALAEILSVDPTRRHALHASLVRSLEKLDPAIVRFVSPSKLGR